jgi:hypothetical protein
MPDYDHHPQPSSERHWWLSLRGFIAFIFIIAVGYYLITEHRAHLFNILPLLLLLACPLMHIFMHGKHAMHGDGDHRHREKDKNDSSEK